MMAGWDGMDEATSKSWCQICQVAVGCGDQGRLDVLSRHLSTAPGLKGSGVTRHGKSRAAIVAAATAAGMAAGGVLVADGPKDAGLKKQKSEHKQQIL